MITICESAVNDKIRKPVMCPKCNNGKLGYIPKWSETTVSRRGKPPPDVKTVGVQVKCPVCRKLWIITIE